MTQPIIEIPEGLTQQREALSSVLADLNELAGEYKRLAQRSRRNAADLKRQVSRIEERLADLGISTR